VYRGPSSESPEIYDTLDTLGSLEFVVILGPPHKSPEIHDTLDTLGSLGVKSVMDSGGVCSRTQTNYKLLGGCMEHHSYSKCAPQSMSCTPD
jgi:hypothetical protein